MVFRIIDSQLNWHEVFVDKEFSFLLIEHSWKIRPHRNTKYVFYWRGKKRIYMHRIIMEVKAGQIVDHVNGNGLDNRKQNLRVCSSQQNSFNCRTNNKSSGFKGVTWDKTRKIWAAKITHNYKTINLGRFKSKEEAARRYDLKAKELFGVFARPNGARL